MCNKENLSSFLQKNREIKYLIEKRKTLPNNLLISQIVDKFLKCTDKECLNEFLNAQDLVNIDNTDKLSYMDLKEKIAYELNEIILKLNA